MRLVNPAVGFRPMTRLTKAGPIMEPLVSVPRVMGAKFIATAIAEPWLEWLLFPHRVNYHIEHHLYASVPHYNLPALHRELAGRGLLEGAETASFRRTLAKIFAEPKTTRDPA